MHFYFIRHGQSKNNLLWAQTQSNEGRVADPPLTAAGERQAELVARLLAASNSPSASTGENAQGFHITHVYCSLMERAVATGHKIAKALDLPLLGWTDIHETGGMFLYDEETDSHIPQPGHSRSYFLAHYPRLVPPGDVTEEGWWNRAFETREDRALRARRVLDHLLWKHGKSDDGVVFVSHGEFLNYFLRATLGISERDPEQEIDPPWFAANNTSITHITFDGDRRVVRYVNRVDFLPPDLIT